MLDPTSQDADAALQELRELLLSPDRLTHQRLEAELNHLAGVFEDREELHRRLQPIFEDHTEYLRQEFPALFGQALGPAIKVQIREAQGEIIDALYPIMGKLIRRYLSAEIERISQQIDDRLRDPFSWETLKLRLKAWFTRTSYQELLLRHSAPPMLQDIFVIDKQNGLSLAHHSLHQLTQPDVVAGMLTGIKSFVEHAFDQGKQELRQLDYEAFKLVIFSFETFYVAAGISGQPDVRFREDLYQQILSFVEKNPIHLSSDLTRQDQDALSKALKDHFDGSKLYH